MRIITGYGAEASIAGDAKVVEKMGELPSLDKISRGSFRHHGCGHSTYTINVN